MMLHWFGLPGSLPGCGAGIAGVQAAQPWTPQAALQELQRGFMQRLWLRDKKRRKSQYIWTRSERMKRQKKNVVLGSTARGKVRSKMVNESWLSAARAINREGQQHEWGVALERAPGCCRWELWLHSALSQGHPSWRSFFLVDKHAAQSCHAGAWHPEE